MQLLTPYTLAGKRLKNRIVFPAVLSNYSEQNRVTQRLIDYVEARAAGGAAMIITEGLSVHPSSVPQPHVVSERGASAPRHRSREPAPPCTP